MLKVASQPLELRGIANNTAKSGKAYYTINTEAEDGTPYAFYCPDFNALPQGLKKGDEVRIYFNVRYFQGKERLEVEKVEKIA